MDITKIRSLFPITKEAIYLNSASQAPLNTRVQNKLEAYLKSETTFEGKKGFNRDDILEAHVKPLFLQTMQDSKKLQL